MILREPPEIAYLREQEQREQEQDQMAEAWGHDVLALEEMIRRWGTSAVLKELANLHEKLSQDGSKVLWSVPSRAYLMGGYDSPDPCSCDEF
jgi:hypothetical protein